MVSNAEILAAVVTKWAMPLATKLMSDNIGKLPFLENFQSKVRASGWVSQKWSVAAELSPFAEPIVKSVITPIIAKYMQNIPDGQIPQMAHGIVDAAIEKGELKLFDGNLIFNKADLQDLKRLLNANLSLPTDLSTYQVKEE